MVKHNKKHAYLLMIHHRKDLIDLLLEELDDERNDIFMHIDSRSKLDFNSFKTTKAGLYKVKQMKVNWGGYSQIKCELRLMEDACKHGPYAYYHFVQGSSFPLKTQDELHQFYDERQGVEFVQIDQTLKITRVELIHLFNEHYTIKHQYEKILLAISKKFINFQKIIGYNHFKQFNMEYKKGFALWSIDHELLTYLLTKKDLIRKMCRFSYCADEIFIQTLTYNSKFKDRINFIDDKFSSSLWFSTWRIDDKRRGCNFISEDLDAILNSGSNFARKFESEDGIELIYSIKKQLDKRRQKI